MIPLIYILPTNDIFQSASGIVHEITPKYSNFRDTIQIEFRYNLDRFFFLEIILSEFDQPESIKMYSDESEIYIEVDDSQNSYSLVAEEVVLVIEKNAILDIMNNVANYETFYSGMSIDLRIIKPQGDRSTRPKLTRVSNWGEGITLDIEGHTLSYFDGTLDTLYQPQLGARNNLVRLPYRADFNYFFYDLDDIVPGHSLLIVPPKDIMNHYLFRGKNALSVLELKNNKLVVLNNSDVLSVTNGVPSHNFVKKSFENFIEFKTGEEYKTLMFNSAYDKNLYTEISLLIPSVRHNGMSIYDFEHNTMVKGSISQRVLVDPVTDLVSHTIRMHNTRDFFSQSYPYEFEFIYDPKVIFQSVRINAIENIFDFGVLYKISKDTGEREIVPMSETPIQKNHKGFVSGSNNLIFASIKKERIISFTKDRMIENGLPKQISSTDSIHGIYSIESIDYESKTIVVSAGTTSEEYSFSNPKVNSILSTVGDSAIINESGATNFGGIEFKLPMLKIDMDFINIETFNDAVLLSRVAEDSDYGITKIISDCNRFMHHMFIDFNTTQLLLIFNQIQDKIYYIEYSRKVVNTDLGNLDYVIDRLISVPDERKLKDFLMFHSIGKGFNRIPGVSQIIEAYPEGRSAKRIDSILTVNSDLTLGRFAFIGGVLRDYDHIIDGTAGDILYSPREYKNNEIVKYFKKSAVNFRPIGNGIFGNGDHTISSMSVSASKATIQFTVGEVTASMDILTDGGSLEFKNSFRVSLNDGNYLHDELIPFEIISSSMIKKVFQVFDMVVVEFETIGSIAFNFQAIKHMINNDDLSINGSISHYSDGYMIAFRLDQVNTVDFASFSAIQKTEAYPVYQHENYDIILDILSKEKWESYLDEDDEDRVKIAVYTISENGNDGVAFPIEYAKFFQLKEQ